MDDYTKIKDLERQLEIYKKHRIYTLIIGIGIGLMLGLNIV